MKRPLVALALALSVAGTELQAQETGPQSSLVFGVAGAFTAGTSLWQVDGQPLQDPGVPEIDTVSLSRDIDGGLGLMFYGMYFPTASLGLSGEVFFMGTGYQDECNLTFQTPAPLPTAACTAADGGSNGTSTVMITAGGLWRINPRKTITPYLRLSLGLAIINRSSVEVGGQTSAGFVRLYDDPDPRNVTPAVVAGLGFTARTKRGDYQIRLEFRDNIVGYDVVTGTAGRAGLKPPSELQFKHLFSFVLGFDIVLEKSRGRRY